MPPPLRVVRRRDRGPLPAVVLARGERAGDARVPFELWAVAAAVEELDRAVDPGGPLVRRDLDRRRARAEHGAPQESALGVELVQEHPGQDRAQILARDL